MSDEAYTEQDRANEGCCWDYPRDQCPKHRQQPCACVCHRNEPTRPANEQDMLQEIARLRRQRDTALDMAQEDRAALAAAEARAAAAEQRVAELERGERLGDVIIKANAESIADLEDERDRYRQRAEAERARADAAVAMLTVAFDKIDAFQQYADWIVKGWSPRTAHEKAVALELWSKVEAKTQELAAILAAQQGAEVRHRFCSHTRGQPCDLDDAAPTAAPGAGEGY